MSRSVGRLPRERVGKSYHFQLSLRHAGSLAFLGCALACFTSAAHADPGDLGDVIVTSTLRRAAILDVPGSVTVLEPAALEGAGTQHFENLISLVPNLNWAGDTARPRYFQIRGIGELAQYQGAPNPSDRKSVV